MHKMFQIFHQRRVQNARCCDGGLWTDLYNYTLKIMGGGFQYLVKPHVICSKQWLVCMIPKLSGGYACIDKDAIQ